MTTGSVTLPTLNTMGHYPQQSLDEKPQQPGMLTPEQQLLLIANASNDNLEIMARNEAARDYNQDPTRKVTEVVGTAIPYVDSVVQGALHKGSSSAQLAKTVSKGSDWGIFTGAVWLYHKALDKVYDNVPGLRNFKEDNPTLAFVGELISAVGVGQAAIWGYNKAVEKVTKGKTVTEVVEGWISKSPKTAETVAKVFKPIQMIPEKVRGYLGLGIFLTFGGIILKNIFDVHNKKVQEDKRLEELKDEREAAKILLGRKMDAQAS